MQIKFFNPTLSRKPRLQRQRRIFPKHKGYLIFIIVIVCFYHMSYCMRCFCYFLVGVGAENWFSGYSCPALPNDFICLEVALQSATCCKSCGGNKQVRASCWKPSLLRLCQVLAVCTSPSQRLLKEGVITGKVCNRTPVLGWQCAPRRHSDC